ncbi:hypothetical protein GE09DRAFT_975298 [Coniochaeta sp. 2T2.1]|nr:hypothetical protein GE09DRAFT_975298 [Coniochaeta sp. 2T2.1]
MANNTTQEEVPDLLYHTLLTVIDFHDDTSGYTRSTYPLGTNTTLPAAKAFAAQALEKLNYTPDDFETYAVHTPENNDTWPHGDGVIVYAKAPAGHELVVKLDTTSNDERLSADSDNNTPRLPSPSDHLHYVLQTKVDYHQDRSGASQTTQIEGVYVYRRDALRAAKGMLGDKSEYAQYDERSDLNGQWPFGDDAVVHAVGQTGENYSVAVRTVPGSHKKHAKKM